jgi:hypothetical protein
LSARRSAPRFVHCCAFSEQLHRSAAACASAEFLELNVTDTR